MFRFLSNTLALLLCTMACTAVQAQAYPNKPIRLVVPFAPGSSIDVANRIVGQKLGEQLGQTVIVDNRLGAGGSIGGTFVARAAPDGYTVLAGSAGSMVGPATFSAKPPYDSLTDFVPVVLMVRIPNFIFVKSTSPNKTIGDLLAQAKAQPGKLSFGSAGIATSTHISGEMLKSMGGVNIVHVPYKGTPAALADLLAGEVDFIVGDTSGLPMVKDGRIRALGSTLATRSSLTPDIPTIAESGLAGYEVTNWQGWFLPAGTPKDVVARLNTAVLATLADPEVRQKLLAASLEPVGNTPEYLATYMREEIARWKAVAVKNNIKVEQ